MKNENKENDRASEMIARPILYMAAFSKGRRLATASCSITAAFSNFVQIAPETILKFVKVTPEIILKFVKITPKTFSKFVNFLPNKIANFGNRLYNHLIIIIRERK